MKQNLKIARNKWIQRYAERMLKAWSMQNCPLVISGDYLSFCRNYLAEFFNDPLKQAFIEGTYRLA